MATARLDQTLALGIKGYAWLPDLRRRTHGQPVRMRLLGRPAVAIGGPAAAQFFYEAGNVERHGAVHPPDGRAHELRKALLMGDGVDTLAKLVGAAFDEAADGWTGRGEISLFDETAKVITDAVTRWSGVPVDGFATAGPRHARAWLARRRLEHRLAKIIEAVRREDPSPTALCYLTDARTAAAEVIDIIRPAAAVTWLVAFAAHAMERWPRTRARLTDDRYAWAFAQEVRRFYPFTPFLAGPAARDLHFQRTDIPRGTTILLDVYGQHHDPRVWPEPYEFRPERFLGRPVGEFELLPQGGGEQITVAVLGTLAQRLARLEYYVPPQNLSIDLTRIPARVHDGPRIVVHQAQSISGDRK